MRARPILLRGASIALISGGFGYGIYYAFGAPANRRRRRRRRRIDNNANSDDADYIYVPLHGPVAQVRDAFESPWRLVLKARSLSKAAEKQLLLDDLFGSQTAESWNVEHALQIAKTDPFLLLGFARNAGRFNCGLGFMPPIAASSSSPPLVAASVLRRQLMNVLQHLDSSQLAAAAVALRRKALNAAYRADKLDHLLRSSQMDEGDDDVADDGVDASTTMLVEALARCSEVPRLGDDMHARGIIWLLDSLMLSRRDTPLTTKRALSKLLANVICDVRRDEIALYDALCRSAILSKLFAWAQSSDLDLSLRAGKALANLDWSNWDGVEYAHGIYLLSPLCRSMNEPLVDVVFIHGLRGGLFTWRQNENAAPRTTEYSNCWPRDWLAADVPHLRVLAVDYETSFYGTVHLASSVIAARTTIEARAIDFLYKLRLAGIGDRPIIWCAHSMGGLIVKQLLLAAAAQPGLLHPIAANTKGIVFYSTPHLGSPTASGFAKWVPVSPDVLDLRLDSPHLIHLHDEFINLVKEQEIPLLSFGEAMPDEKSGLLGGGWRTYPVPIRSANPRVGDFIILDNETHFYSCKPASRASRQYVELLGFCQSVIRNINQQRKAESDTVKAERNGMLNAADYVNLAWWL